MAWERPDGVRHPFDGEVLMKHYIMIQRPDLVPAYAALVGPFGSEERACAWGVKWQEATGDNPCWQHLYMRSDFRVMHVKPEDVLL